MQTREVEFEGLLNQGDALHAGLVTVLDTARIILARAHAVFHLVGFKSCPKQGSFGLEDPHLATHGADPTADHRIVQLLKRPRDWSGLGRGLGLGRTLRLHDLVGGGCSSGVHHVGELNGTTVLNGCFHQKKHSH